MKAADLNRFMVTCALVSDLYYSGFGGDEVLSKESNLAQAASRYKVSAAKIAASVKADLATRKRKPRAKKRGLKKRDAD